MLLNEWSMNRPSANATGMLVASARPEFTASSSLRRYGSARPRKPPRLGAITPFDLGEDRFPGGSQLVAEHHLVERREALGDGELLAVRRVAVVQEAAHHVHFPRFNQVDGILVRTGMHEDEREPVRSVTRSSTSFSMPWYSPSRS